MDRDRVFVFLEIKFCCGEMKGNHLVQMTSAWGITHPKPVRHQVQKLEQMIFLEQIRWGWFVIYLNKPFIVDSLHEESEN